MKLVIEIDDRLFRRWKNIEMPTVEEVRKVQDDFVTGTPLSKGHGRLIDADALVYWECNSDCDMCCDDDKCGMVKEAPTIIEADKQDEPIRQNTLCIYDEAFTIDEMLEETGKCAICNIKECANYRKIEADKESKE